MILLLIIVLLKLIYFSINDFFKRQFKIIMTEWLKYIDEESLDYADRNIQLQDWLSQLNENNFNEISEQILKSTFSQESDAVCMLVENIISLISINPHILSNLSKLCDKIITNCQFGTAITEFGSLLLFTLLHIVNDENYIIKSPLYKFLRYCLFEEIYSINDIIPSLKDLMNMNFYNQFTLLFLYFLPEINEELFNLFLNFIEENIQKIDNKLIYFINKINEYKLNKF